MNANKLNPDMLRLAREARELTQVELAKAAGVTQALVSKLEHGLIGQPSDDVLDKLSGALRFPPAFLFQAERAVGFPPFHYRKRMKLGAKPLARIGAIINIRRQHVAKLMRSYEIEVVKPIPMIDLDGSGLTPETVAERMRAYWMLPRGPVASVVDVVEQAGGIVVLTRFGTTLLDGISFRSEGLPPLFFMNKDVPGERFRFTLAHELGHIIMHTMPDDDEKMEDEAHRFAAAFLMPATDVKPYLVSAKLSNLTRVKGFWRVSIKSLIRRAHELKLISDHQYKTLNMDYGKSFKAGEPSPVELEQPWRLKEIIRYHREKLGYSLSDLAALFCASEEDVERAYLERPGLRLVVSK